MIRSLFVLILALLPAVCRAEILFVDLNFSSGEVRAARQAAKARGERLLVVPEIPAAERAKIDELSYELELAAGKRAALVTALEERRQEIADRYPLRLAKLEAAIESAEAGGGAVTSLVLSGHSYGTGFFGLAAQEDVSREELGEVFARHPKSLGAVRSILLMGCYSAERETAEWWQGAFPRAGLVMGFAGFAPLGDTDDSPALLRDVLVKEGFLIAQPDLRRAAAAIRALDHVREVHAVFAIGQFYVGTGMAPTTLSEADLHCGDAEKRLKKGSLVFNAYFNAKTLADPPEDVHRSELRDFYSDLQRFADCRKESRGMPERREVLALIFFRNVRKSFAAHFRKELAAVDAVFSAHGVPAMPDLARKELTRADVLRAIDRIFAEAADARYSKAEIVVIRALANPMNTHLSFLEKVPGSWMTD